MKVYDLDVSKRTLMIRQGKGNQDRMLPIGERAIAWTQKYLGEVRPLLIAPPDDHDLFLTDYGEPYTGSNIGRLVKKHMLQAGLHYTGSCHLFRHAMATHMLENGADIRFIQAMLGHSDLSTTEVYTHVAIDKLQAIHAATHPARLHRKQKPQQGTAGACDNEALDRLLLVLNEQSEDAEKGEI